MNPDGVESLAARMVPSLRSIAPQGLISGVLPLVIYAVIRPQLSSDAEGLLVVIVFPVAETIFEAARTKRLEPIGIISMTGIALGVAGALALHGDALLLKIRSSAITGIFGAGCLFSLTLAKPVMWHLARAFATEGNGEKQQLFDALWFLPRVARRFKLITVTWATVLLAEAGIQISFALTLSTGDFLVVSLALNVTALVGLLIGTRTFVRASLPLLVPARSHDTRRRDPLHTE